MPSKRQREAANWGTVMTDETGSQATKYLELMMDEKLEALKKNWASRTPDKEFSITLGTGTLVYIGRYPQGVVIKLNDNSEQVTYLTNEMASKLGVILGQES